jgi:ankyrin repeat protein
MRSPAPNSLHDALDYRRLAGIALLCVILFTLSTLAFVFRYRNDLLILASNQRQLRAVETLIAMGATARSATGIFPEPALIEYLLVLQAPNQPVTEGAQIAQALLSAGASLTERNAGGWTPLMLAAASGQLPIVELLMKKGSDVDARALGGEQTEGLTALMAAAMHGHVAIARYLIERGATIHFRTRAGYNALLLAASRGHLNTVNLLLEKGASVPQTTIQLAERNGHVEVAKRLRNAQNIHRPETPLRRPAKFPEE